MIEGLDFDYLLADRAYGAQDFIGLLLKCDTEPVIPPKKNAKLPRNYDEWRYRERHLVECFISKIKHFRRVFSGFDKLARPYLGFIQLASTLIWLR